MVLIKGLRKYRPKENVTNQVLEWFHSCCTARGGAGHLCLRVMLLKEWGFLAPEVNSSQDTFQKPLSCAEAALAALVRCERAVAKRKIAASSNRGEL